jgi:predicted DNA-binding protein (MmcQ/YjbR family)
MMLGVASPNGAEEPPPYFASRGMKWIQQYSVPGMSDKELKNHLATSHHLASLNLTMKRQKELGLNQD